MKPIRLFHTRLMSLSSSCSFSEQTAVALMPSSTRLVTRYTSTTPVTARKIISAINKPFPTHGGLIVMAIKTTKCGWKKRDTMFCDRYGMTNYNPWLFILAATSEWKNENMFLLHVKTIASGAIPTIPQTECHFKMKPLERLGIALLWNTSLHRSDPQCTAGSIWVGSIPKCWLWHDSGLWYLCIDDTMMPQAINK